MAGDRLAEAATRMYERLLVLLPAEDRSRDGRSMVRLFSRLATDARARGPIAFVLVIVRSFLDLVLHSLRLRSAIRAGDSIEEATGSRRRRMMFDFLGQDVRLAVRSLRRRPGFALLACTTFALGIGSASTMFSVVDAMLLRRLPYEQPDRIVRLMGTYDAVVSGSGTLSYPNVRDIFERGTSFASGAAYDEWQPNLTGSGDPERLDAATVNASYFEVFGIRPAAGRFFEPQEDIAGRDRVVVLGWGLWQRRFGGDPGIVGRSIELNGNPHVVIGIAPRDFEDPRLSGGSFGTPMLWRPLGFGGIDEDQLPSRSSSSFVAVARLSPGVTVERANSEMAALSKALEQEFPDDNEGVGMTAVPLHESIVAGSKASLLLLLGAVGFVLAIAAVNVGNLLLGRAAGQRHELALRTAIGASRRRVVAQTITETLVLAFLGAAGGIVMATVLIRLVSSIAAGFVPRNVPLVIDLPVLGFAIGITVIAGLFCAVVPAMAAAGSDPRSSLGESGRGTTATRRSGRVRRALITAESALALLLLIGAGLVGRSLWKLMNVEVGIDPENLLTFHIALPAASYPQTDNAIAFYQELLTRLDALPGVQSAAAINIIPLSGSFDCNTITTVENPDPAPDESVCPQTRTVTPSYFETAGVRLIAGRYLEDRDRVGSPHAVVVTQALARRFWNGEVAVGRRLLIRGEPAEVVGVVGDVKHLGLDEPAPPLFYTSNAQAIYTGHARRLAVLVRTSGDPAALAPAVRREVRALDPQLPIARLQTMRQIVNSSASAPRFRTTLFGSFAALALLLAAVGIYGVVSFSVTQRNRELAIRAALGARTGALRRMVVKDGLAPVAAGLTIGLGAAFILSRILTAVLFDVTATDGAVFVAVPLVLLLVALLASFLPALRATRADPMGVLRDS